MVECQNDSRIYMDRSEDNGFKCMDRHEDKCQQ